MKNYALPEVLVSTDWVDQHKNDQNVVIVEVDIDTNSYEEGHMSNAVGWNWHTQLCDTLQRDINKINELESLFNTSGISNDSIIDSLTNC